MKVKLVLNSLFVVLLTLTPFVYCDVSELIYQNEGSQQEDKSGEDDTPLAVDLLSKGNFNSENDNNEEQFTILTNNNLGEKVDEPRFNILTERPYVAPNTNNDETFSGYNYEKPAIKFEFGSSEQKDKIEEFNGYDYPKPLKQLGYPSDPSSIDLPEDAIRSISDSSESELINPTYNN